MSGSRVRLAVATMAFALLAACGADTESSDSASSPSEAPAEVAADAPTAGAQTSGVADSRVQIVTAHVTVVVDDPAASAAKAGELAADAGGYVEAESTDAAGDAGSYLTLRIPVGDLEVAMDTLAAYGDLESRGVQREDVTAQVADVDSRIASAEASIARLNELLARAESTEAIVAVESELATREADLEALQAQQKALANQVALASIAVTFTTEPAAVTDEWPGPLDALRNGLEFVLGLLRGLLLVAAFILPILVLALPFAWWGRRRIRRRAALRAEAAQRPREPLPPPTAQ